MLLNAINGRGGRLTSRLPEGRLSGQTNAFQRWIDLAPKWKGWAANKGMSAAFVWSLHIAGCVRICRQGAVIVKACDLGSQRHVLCADPSSLATVIAAEDDVTVTLTDSQLSSRVHDDPTDGTYR